MNIYKQNKGHFIKKVDRKIQKIDNFHEKYAKNLNFVAIIRLFI